MFEKTHVITLFSGRWQTFEPYFHSLLALDYPREKLELIWYTNAPDSFVKFLSFRSQELAAVGFKIRIYQDRSVPISENASVENGPRPAEHALTIASLYNSALATIRTNQLKRVYFLEDDISVHPSNLKSLHLALNNDKDAAYITSVVFDRHKSQVFAWDIDIVPKGYNNTKHTMYRSKHSPATWGVREIGMGGLAAVLIDFTRFPSKLKRPYFRPQVRLKGAEHFVGCDIVLCFYLYRYGVKRLIDWNQRTLHYDSKGLPH